MNSLTDYCIEIRAKITNTTETVIQFPELMERVRFNTKNDRQTSIWITEFDKSHLETRGRRCHLERTRIECVEADGSTSLEQDFGARVYGIEDEIENFEVAMGSDDSGDFLRIGYLEFREPHGFRMDKLHYLSIKSDSPSRWIVSDGNCAEESQDDLDWLDELDAFETQCDLNVQTPSSMGMVKVAEGRENLDMVHFNVEGMTDLHIILSTEDPASNDANTIEIILGHKNGECIGAKADAKCWDSRSYIRRGIGNTENEVQADHTPWQFHMVSG